MKTLTTLLLFVLSLSAKTITDSYGRVIVVPETITKIYAASHRRLP